MPSMVLFAAGGGIAAIWGIAHLFVKTGAAALILVGSSG